MPIKILEQIAQNKQKPIRLKANNQIVNLTGGTWA